MLLKSIHEIIFSYPTIGPSDALFDSFSSPPFSGQSQIIWDFSPIVQILLTNGPSVLWLSSLCKSQGISNALALIETEAGRAESRTSGTDLRYSLKLASSDNNSRLYGQTKTLQDRCSCSAGLNLYMFDHLYLSHKQGFVSSHVY